MIFYENVARLLKGRRLLKYKSKEQLVQELKDVNRPIAGVYHVKCFKDKIVANSPGYLEDAVTLCYFAILKYSTQECVVFSETTAFSYGVYGPEHYTQADFSKWLRICISIYRQHEQRTTNQRGNEGDRNAPREDGYVTVNNFVENEVIGVVGDDWPF